MSDATAIIRAIAETAKDWSNPDYSVRAEAVTEALQGANKFTEEAVAFAINQHMSQLQLSSMDAWLAGKHTSSAQGVVLVHGGRAPLEEIRMWVAIVGAGCRHIGWYDEGPPALLRAFIDDAQKRCGSIPSTLHTWGEEMDEPEAVIAMGVEEDSPAAAFLEENNASGKKGVIRKSRRGIAILDGKEGQQDIEQLAEDVLLHEGMVEENVSMIWAPAELNPDPYLEAFALFRSIFPAHERTAGSLQMRKAFLAAQNAPHAYGEGLEFLVSKGNPEFQEPGHVRWVPYSDISESDAWIAENQAALQHVLVRSGSRKQQPPSVPVASFGEAHRSSLKTDRNANEVLDVLQEN